MRYTPENGTICIAARTEHGQPLFEVRDSGSGVPRPNCRDWSKRFYQRPRRHCRSAVAAWRSCVASANCTRPAWKSRTSLAAASQHGCAGAETVRRGRFKPGSDSREQCGASTHTKARHRYPMNTSMAAAAPSSPRREPHRLACGLGWAFLFFWYFSGVVSCCS